MLSSQKYMYCDPPTLQCMQPAHTPPPTHTHTRTTHTHTPPSPGPQTHTPSTHTRTRTNTSSLPRAPHAHLQFVALLAFALTAGFHSSGDSNSVTCTSNQTGLPNYTAAVDFTYPYTINSYSARVLTSDNFTNNNTQCRGAGDTHSAYVTLCLYKQHIVIASVV